MAFCRRASYHKRIQGIKEDMYSSVTGFVKENKICWEECNEVRRSHFYLVNSFKKVSFMNENNRFSA
jgi:hypothetical protein